MIFAIRTVAFCAGKARLNVFILALSVWVAGCALPDKPRPSVSYDFGPGAVRETTGAATAQQAALILAEVETSAALEGTAVLYRLAYADAQALYPYAQARWSMPPAQLVRQQARAQLGATRAVLSSGDIAESTARTATPRQVRLELEEFSQVFESPSASSGLVRLRVSVTQASPQGERLIAQRVIRVQRPAPTADAPGGVRALTLATEAAMADLDAWLRQLPS